MSLHPILFSLLTPGEFEKTIINKRELTEKKNKEEKKKRREKQRDSARETHRGTEEQTHTDRRASMQAGRQN